MHDIIKETIKIFSDPYKGMIYHYTNADGLSGIVGNHEIWMSNTLFMNDIKELKALQDNHSLIDQKELENEYVQNSWKDSYVIQDKVILIIWLHSADRETFRTMACIWKLLHWF